MIKVAILSIAGGDSEEEDQTKPIIKEFVDKIGGKEVCYKRVPESFGKIREALFNISERGMADLILTSGGTGFARKDVTPEATMAVIEREVPGITELMRWELMKRCPEACLTRARAGIRKSTLIVNLPGKPGEIKDSLESICTVLIHGLAELKKV
ncbi:MogA/MoaB family molybdenum cofactor biosynthesis protein [Halothermothrix orenii]|uniref:Molybdenum cofactor synthesis domain protein n=1 Tax=Halothermothrix orenii (strain H 168 / OCM 544 / DSM 9562) TaxID=373903 RepID=B8CY38_HALOH|nr:MogA/MoaB family molybdenum cofactor biosynthesis protein [Halothermothrix orenii]ACL70207.1 molybdenum cofactor synthesis domain protein [Halothermothrix orenii H 168]